MGQPTDALDYPRHDPDLWVLWHCNEHKWPDGRRETSYLAKDKMATLGRFALFTIFPEEAATFSSEKEARDWLAEHEARRPQPYHNIRVTTVRQLIAERF